MLGFAWQAAACILSLCKSQCSLSYTHPLPPARLLADQSAVVLASSVRDNAKKQNRRKLAQTIARKAKCRPQALSMMLDFVPLSACKSAPLMWISSCSVQDTGCSHGHDMLYASGASIRNEGMKGLKSAHHMGCIPKKVCLKSPGKGHVGGSNCKAADEHRDDNRSRRKARTCYLLQSAFRGYVPVLAGQKGLRPRQRIRAILGNACVNTRRM